MVEGIDSFKETILRVEEKAKQLEGEYFTDRNTIGDICLQGIELKK